MSEPNIVAVKRALISVSDKTGIVDFAQGLRDQGVELLSTGGTFRLLEENGIEVTEISAYTGFPEMMDGRVKTLHPFVPQSSLPGIPQPIWIIRLCPSIGWP